MTMNHQTDKEKIAVQAQVADNALELQKKQSNETKKEQKKTVSDSRIPGRRLGSK